jgi:RNA-binding motif protein, X-linked 2
MAFEQPQEKRRRRRRRRETERSTLCVVMDKVKSIEQLNEREMQLGITVGKGSWHDEYADSAYVFLGGLSPELTEGDVLVIASQFGTPIDVNLVRDKETGESKGFAFVAYADQRSTVLAVDNFTGAQFMGKTLRCDHVPSYRIPSSKDGAKKKKKRAVTDDSTSSDSGTDSELELYRGSTDGLTPLQRRMIRAEVKRELAKRKEGGAAAEPADDKEEAATKERRYAHSFYAVEETSEERKKRERREKKKEKQERREKKLREREEAAAQQRRESAPPPPPPQGGMANPFLAAKLRELKDEPRV